jgi:Zn-finger nucleic acid-binding protein
MRCPKCGLEEIMHYRFLGVEINQCEICGYAWENKEEK